ncbi:MAG: exosortase K [Clostridiales bacterium]|jgi:exosortase K|nr:exosortase K [Clostridiales bacterium]
MEEFSQSNTPDLMGVIFLKGKFWVVIAFALFIGLLFYKTYIPENHAKFLLLPVAKAAEVFYNTSHVYAAGIGFAQVNGEYVIGADCLPLSFTAMLFLLCSLSPPKRFLQGGGISGFVWVMLCVPISFFAGFAVNLVRILASLNFVRFKYFHALHLAVGVLLYISSLCAAYWVLKRGALNEK